MGVSRVPIVVQAPPRISCGWRRAFGSGRSEVIAGSMNLSEADLSELLPSGTQTKLITAWRGLELFCPGKGSRVYCLVCPSNFLITRKVFFIFVDSGLRQLCRSGCSARALAVVAYGEPATKHY